MAAKCFVVVFLCFFIPSQILADQEPTTPPTAIAGLSPWCTGGKTDVAYPKAPAKCCTSDYACNVIVNSGETKNGFTNRSSWAQRLCTCEVKFVDCLLNNLDPMGSARAYMLMIRHSCLRKKQCPLGQTCEVEYESINMGHLLTDDRM